MFKLSKKRVMKLIFITLIIISFSLSSCLSNISPQPDPSPYVNPYTPLSVNTTLNLVVKQVQISKDMGTIFLFHTISIPELVQNASIKIDILTLPTENNNKGLLKYTVTYLNGTNRDYGVFNSSWYDFYASPFIYPDTEGWNQYFTAWKNKNVTDQSYLDYNYFNYTLQVTEDYFGINSNHEPEFGDNGVYQYKREIEHKFWFDKNTGEMVYGYWYFNYTLTYNDNNKDPDVYAFLVELYQPGVDLSQINQQTVSTSSGENHVFQLPAPSIPIVFLTLTLFTFILSRKHGKRKLI